jgi:hypothetical protein
VLGVVRAEAERIVRPETGGMVFGSDRRAGAVTPLVAGVVKASVARRKRVEHKRRDADDD